MIDFLSTHWGSWIILLLLLFWTFYTLVVIKEEKESYLENAGPFPFHQFQFQVPSWWENILKEERHISWKRADARYEWRANLYWEDSLQKEISIEEDFKNRIEGMEIIFDFDSSDIRTPREIKENFPHIPEYIEIVRVEGTATQGGIKRRYLDAFLFRDHLAQNTLFATSLSSVLNGGIEGPYFEHMILNFQTQNS